MAASDPVATPSDDVRTVLDAMATPLSQTKNSVIFNQGDEPVGIYVIRKGSVRMTVKAGATDVLMRVAQPGSVLGLPAVLGAKPYSLTAKTAQATELGFVRGEKLIELIRSNPSLGLQVLQLLSEEVRAARGAIASTRQVVKA